MFLFCWRFWECPESETVKKWAKKRAQKSRHSWTLASRKQTKKKKIQDSVRSTKSIKPFSIIFHHFLEILSLESAAMQKSTIDSERQFWTAPDPNPVRVLIRSRYLFWPLDPQTVSNENQEKIVLLGYFLVVWRDGLTRRCLKSKMEDWSLLTTFSKILTQSFISFRF